MRRLLRLVRQVVNTNAESLQETQTNLHNAILLLGKVAAITKAQNSSLDTLFLLLRRQGLFDDVGATPEQVQDLIDSFQRQRSEISELAGKLADAYSCKTSPLVLVNKDS